MLHRVLLSIALVVVVAQTARAQDVEIGQPVVRPREQGDAEPVAAPTQSASRPLGWSDPSGDATAPSGYAYTPTTTATADPVASAEGYGDAPLPPAYAPPAQQATPPATSTPPATTFESQRPTYTDSAEPSRLPRIAVEALAGLGGSFFGALLGLLIADQLCSSGCDEDIVVGAAVGLLLGLPVGVWTGGIAMDGNGGLGWAIAGSMIGWVGTGVLVSLADDSGDDTGWLTALGVAMPIGGAILGFELSSDASATRARSIRASISPRGQGAVLGLTATF